MGDKDNSKQNLGITFGDIHSDEPHEAVTPEDTHDIFEKKHSHLSSHGKVFNVASAMDEEEQEEGTIVSDKRRHHMSLGESLSDAFSEWSQRTKRKLSHLGETVNEKIPKAEEEKKVSKPEERKETIEKAAKHSILPPQKAPIKIEKVKTFKKDFEGATGGGVRIKEPPKIEKPEWTRKQEEKHETPINQKSGQDKPLQPSEPHASLVAPVIKNKIQKPISDFVPAKEIPEAPPVKKFSSASGFKYKQPTMQPQTYGMVAPVVTPERRVPPKNPISENQKNIPTPPQHTKEAPLEDIELKNTVQEAIEVGAEKKKDVLEHVTQPEDPPQKQNNKIVVSPIQSKPRWDSEMVEKFDEVIIPSHEMHFDKGKIMPPLKPIAAPRRTWENTTHTPESVPPAAPQKPSAQPPKAPEPETTPITPERTPPAPVVNEVSHEAPPHLPIATIPAQHNNGTSELPNDIPLPQRNKPPIAPVPATPPVRHFDSPERPSMPLQKTDGYTNAPRPSVPQPQETPARTPEPIQIPKPSIPEPVPTPTIEEPQKPAEPAPVTQEQVRPAPAVAETPQEALNVPTIEPVTQTPEAQFRSATPVQETAPVTPEPKLQVSRPQETPKPVAKSSKHTLKIMIIGGSVVAIIIIIAVALLMWNISGSQNQAPDVPQPNYQLPVSSFIETSSQTTIPLTGTQSAFIANFNTLVRQADRSVPVTEIVPTIVEGNSVSLASSAELFAFLEARVPPSLVRVITDDYMIGAVQGGTSEPFIMLRSYNFDVFFTSMLAWERTLAEDLAPLMNNISVPDTRFKDAVRGNASTRILYDDNGNELLLYSFVNNNTVIITTTSDALSVLIREI